MQSLIGSFRARAFAKINLSLRVLGVSCGRLSRASDGLSIRRSAPRSFREAPGAFRIETDDPDCPSDRTNLVWRAAEHVWRAAGRRGAPRDVVVRIVKRIPVQAGLGGGSSDAAAALRALAALWRVTIDPERLRAHAASLGADVPFFLEGGAALGAERGDVLFPLVDSATAWVTIVVPPFGVSTRTHTPGGTKRVGTGRALTVRRARGPRRHPREGEPLDPAGLELLRRASCGTISSRRSRGGIRPSHGSSRLFGARARHAAMSGSGSAVFGLFPGRDRAARAALALGRRGRTFVTRTLSRARVPDARADQGRVPESRCVVSGFDRRRAGPTVRLPVPAELDTDVPLTVRILPGLQSIVYTLPFAPRRSVHSRGQLLPFRREVVGRASAAGPRASVAPPA